MLARRTFVGLTASATLAISARQAGHAQTYPSRPVHLMVAFTPGGPSDTLARILGGKLEQELGEPMVVDNHPGAGGNIAADLAARQTPDGYNLLVANNSILAANAFLYRHLSFDPVKDFAPIALIGRQPNILVVTPKLGVNSVAELIALAKAKPGTLNFASSGFGTAAHLAGEMFRLQADINIVHVAYPGVAPALTDLMSGQTQMMFATSVAAIPFIQSGALRALAVTTAERTSAMPELPTMQEAGLAGYEATTWHGLVAPAHTPQSVIGSVNAATQSALRAPDVAKRLAGLGVEIASGTPTAFAAYIGTESARWAEVIKRAGIHIG